METTKQKNHIPRKHGFSVSPQKIEVFCHSYLIDFNVTKSAIAAGMPAKSADSAGSRFLNRPDVQARLNELLQEKLHTLEVSKESVLNEIAAVAFSDLTKYAKWGMRERVIKKTKEKVTRPFLDIINSDDIDPRAVQSIKMTQFGPSIKLHDKGAMLTILAKHFKIFTEEKGENDISLTELAIGAAKYLAEQKKASNGNLSAD